MREAVWIDNSCALYHRRVSQYMSSPMAFVAFSALGSRFKGQVSWETQRWVIGRLDTLF